MLPEYPNARLSACLCLCRLSPRQVLKGFCLCVLQTVQEQRAAPGLPLYRTVGMKALPNLDPLLQLGATPPGLCTLDQVLGF